MYISIAETQDVDRCYLQEESPNVYFKMHLTSEFQCVYYDTDTSEWVRGDKSGALK